MITIIRKSKFSECARLKYLQVYMQSALSPSKLMLYGCWMFIIGPSLAVPFYDTITLPCHGLNTNSNEISLFFLFLKAKLLQWNFFHMLHGTARLLFAAYFRRLWLAFSSLSKLLLLYVFTIWYQNWSDAPLLVTSLRDNYTSLYSMTLPIYRF